MAKGTLTGKNQCDILDFNVTMVHLGKLFPINEIVHC